jgi:hypothetical protein
MIMLPTIRNAMLEKPIIISTYSTKLYLKQVEEFKAFPIPCSPIHFTRSFVIPPQKSLGYVIADVHLSARKSVLPPRSKKSKSSMLLPRMEADQVRD